MISTYSTDTKILRTIRTSDNAESVSTNRTANMGTFSTFQTHSKVQSSVIATALVTPTRQANFSKQRSSQTTYGKLNSSHLQWNETSIMAVYSNSINFSVQQSATSVRGHKSAKTTLIASSHMEVSSSFLSKTSRQPHRTNARNTAKLGRTTTTSDDDMVTSKTSDMNLSKTSGSAMKSYPNVRPHTSASNLFLSSRIILPSQSENNLANWSDFRQLSSASEVNGTFVKTAWPSRELTSSSGAVFGKRKADESISKTSYVINSASSASLPTQLGASRTNQTHLSPSSVVGVSAKKSVIARTSVPQRNSSRYRVLKKPENTSDDQYDSSTSYTKYGLPTKSILVLNSTNRVEFQTKLELSSSTSTASKLNFSSAEHQHVSSIHLPLSFHSSTVTSFNIVSSTETTRIHSTTDVYPTTELLTLTMYTADTTEVSLPKENHTTTSIFSNTTLSTLNDTSSSIPIIVFVSSTLAYGMSGSPPHSSDVSSTRFRSIIATTNKSRVFQKESLSLTKMQVTSTNYFGWSTEKASNINAVINSTKEASLESSIMKDFSDNEAHSSSKFNKYTTVSPNSALFMASSSNTHVQSVVPIYTPCYISYMMTVSHRITQSFASSNVGVSPSRSMLLMSTSMQNFSSKKLNSVTSSPFHNMNSLMVKSNVPITTTMLPATSPSMFGESVYQDNTLTEWVFSNMTTSVDNAMYGERTSNKKSIVTSHILAFSASRSQLTFSNYINVTAIGSNITSPGVRSSLTNPNLILPTVSMMQTGNTSSKGVDVGNVQSSTSIANSGFFNNFSKNANYSWNVQETTPSGNRFGDNNETISSNFAVSSTYAKLALSTFPLNHTSTRSYGTQISTLATLNSIGINVASNRNESVPQTPPVISQMVTLSNSTLTVSSSITMRTSNILLTIQSSPGISSWLGKSTAINSMKMGLLATVTSVMNAHNNRTGTENIPQPTPVLSRMPSLNNSTLTVSLLALSLGLDVSFSSRSSQGKLSLLEKAVFVNSTKMGAQSMLSVRFETVSRSKAAIMTIQQNSNGYFTLYVIPTSSLGLCFVGYSTILANVQVSSVNPNTTLVYSSNKTNSTKVTISISSNVVISSTDFLSSSIYRTFTFGVPSLVTRLGVNKSSILLRSQAQNGSSEFKLNTSSLKTSLVGLDTSAIEKTLRSVIRNAILSTISSSASYAVVTRIETPSSNLSHTDLAPSPTIPKLTTTYTAETYTVRSIFSPDMSQVFASIRILPAASTIVSVSSSSVAITKAPNLSVNENSILLIVLQVAPAIDVTTAVFKYNVEKNLNVIYRSGLFVEKGRKRRSIMPVSRVEVR